MSIKKVDKKRGYKKPLLKNLGAIIKVTAASSVKTGPGDDGASGQKSRN